ncbi:MAG: hypothetical protein R3292_10340, partial [Alcanivorax sp.]|nr:hypothetical protein [Alcanivorax sp.]
ASADVKGETSGEGEATAASRGDDAVETKDAAPADTASVKTVAGDESDTRVGKQTPVLRADQQAADSSNVTEGGE